MPVAFASTPTEVAHITDAAIAEAEALLAGIVGTSAPSWETVLAPLDAIGDVLTRASGRAAFPAHVHPDAEVRDAARVADERLSGWGAALPFREDLHAAVTAFAATPAAAGLVGERARFLGMVQRDLRRAGHELDPVAREEVAASTQRLVEIGVAFQRNVAAADDALVVTADDLVGLPSGYAEGLAAGPEPGTLRITMAYPDVIPFLDQSDRRDLRERLERLFLNRAAAANRPLLAEAVRLRARIAELFGQSSWAHHQLELRMAEGPEAVAAFYDELVPSLTAAAQAEVVVLRELLAEVEDDPGVELRSWDWRRCHTELQRRHGVDRERVAAHFPMAQVLDGLLALTGEVFGIRHVEVDLPTWHPDVRSLEIRDAASDELLAHVHLDLFPRPDTFGHAAAFTLVPGRRLADGSYQRPVSAIVANLTPPQGDRPSLLQHGEVETLFHEYGHILHQVLTRAELARFSGTSVERDFVEAPSQIMEHWTWEPEVLARFARHHETGAVLPVALVKAMVAARNLDVALQKLRQVQFGMLDLWLHGPGATELDLDEVNRRATALTLLPFHEGTFFPANFGHLLGGYDAGYYGYLWAEVIGDDLFRRFAEEGPTSPAVGADYRREILAAGGTRDADELVRRFLGREPDNEAFLAKLGIAGAGSTSGAAI